MLITINETSKGKGNGVRDRMWCRGGTLPQVFRYFGCNMTRYSMLAAADINGFVVEACSLVLRKAGEADSDSSHGTIGRARFIVWVKECLVPVLGNYKLQQHRSLVLLDNVTIHHSGEIVELIRMAGAEVFYLSLYSPDFNPIEFYFNIYKKMLKRLQHMNWFMVHYFALHAVTPEHGCNLKKNVKFLCATVLLLTT